MMQKKVSQGVLTHILLPLAMLTDEEEAELLGADIHNEQVLTDIFKTHIPLHVKSYTEESQELMKDSLSYYIKTGSVDLFRLFASHHISLEDPPEDAIPFLKVLWSVVFGDEPIQDNPLSDYTIDDSSNFINSVRK